MAATTADGGGSYDGGEVDEGWRSIVVATAYAQIGSEYVWGGETPGAFDCSGLVKYCYAAAGIGLGHSSGSQSAYCNKPVSQAVPGDICWTPGHVGIYVGNGAVIEAMQPGMGVRYNAGALYGYSSCGSPL